jgi:hypothetical protein
VLFRESEIIIDLMLELIRLGIVALPIHDCVLVQANNAETVKDAMLDTFRAHKGIESSVSIE